MQFRFCKQLTDQIFDLNRLHNFHTEWNYIWPKINENDQDYMQTFEHFQIQFEQKRFHQNLLLTTIFGFQCKNFQTIKTWIQKSDGKEEEESLMLFL